jgi:hypothetical protein
MLDAAVDYAKRGLKILPLSGKVPAIAGGSGYRDASSDPKQVKRWWTAHPDANIGLAMRSNGLLAWDIDPRNDGDKTLAELVKKHGPLPTTIVQKTGRGDGGEHYVFRNDGKSHKSPGPGIDIKDKGYIVVAPSVHPESGQPYAWSARFDLRTLRKPPDWSPIQPVSNRGYHSPTIRLEEDPIYHALRRLGRVHEDQNGPQVGFTENGTERVNIGCPWVHEHTDKIDDGTAYFAGGGFKCHHAHCDNRNGGNLREWLRSQGVNIAQAGRQIEERKREARMRSLSEAADAIAASGAGGYIDLDSFLRGTRVVKNSRTSKAKVKAGRTKRRGGR